MADIDFQWGTASSLTITLASLADGSARQSTAVTNTNGLDVLVRVRLAAAGTTPNYAEIFVYTALGDTTYSGNASGSDAAYSAAQWDNLKKLGLVKVDASNPGTAVFSLARAFGGVLPETWGIIVRNESGTALAASGNSADYQVVRAQTV